MGETPVLIGSLVSWQGLFTAAELDAITRHGDSLALEHPVRTTDSVMSNAGSVIQNVRFAAIVFFRQLRGLRTPLESRQPAKALHRWPL